MPITKNSIAHTFLSGGGEMGELTRSADWSQTPVGSIDTWPQSLRTVVSVILTSKFPMFLWWGDDFIQFYNDAFRPSLGNMGKHPHALGQRGKECWPETWHVIFPLIQQVLSGESTWREDQLVPIYRNGHLEDVYWTYSYSPVRDDEGTINGILAVCNETTQKVLSERHLKKQISNLFIQAPLALCILRGKDYIIEVANERMLELWGKKAENVLNKPLFEGMPDAKGQGFEELLNNVYRKGQRFVAEELPVSLMRHGRMENVFVKFVYEALREEDGTISGIMALADEITEQVLVRKKIEESEERLRLATETTNLGTWEFLPLTGQLTWSDECKRIYQFPVDKDVDYALFSEHIFPEDRDLAQSAILAAMDPSSTGEYNIEYRILRYTDKAVRWIRAQGKVFFNEQKQASRFIGTVLDITDQKVTGETLKENEKKLRVITDAVPHMVWEIELDGTISYINKQWADYSGLTLEEINQGGWSKVFHPDDAENVGKGWTEAFTNKEIYLGECRIKNPEGGYSWFTLKTVPVKNDKDEVELWIGTATDIQDKKIAEQQKDEFISMASHELKTPVTSLKGFTQILRMRFEKEGNNTAAELLTKMDKQVDKLTKLIVDLLDATKIANGQLQFAKEDFEFNELVTEITEEMQHTSDSHKISLNLSHNKIINGDKNRIGQVIINLISNAIKYSPQANQIIVSGTAEKNKIKLCIQDFGIGIPPGELSKIFGRFFRVSGDKQDTFPGLGLGLFIASEIIKRHKGKITVESAEGKGSTFCFTLPVIR